MGLTLGAVNCGVGRHFKYVDKPRAAQGIMYLRVSEFLLILSNAINVIADALGRLDSSNLPGLAWSLFKSLDNVETHVSLCAN